jgi:hypothetical protein
MHVCWPKACALLAWRYDDSRASGWNDLSVRPVRFTNVQSIAESDHATVPNFVPTSNPYQLPPIATQLPENPRQISICSNSSQFTVLHLSC